MDALRIYVWKNREGGVMNEMLRRKKGIDAVVIESRDSLGDFTAGTMHVT
jgi:hypothetical protein